MNDMKERRIKQFHEHKLSLNVKDDGDHHGQGYGRGWTCGDDLLHRTYDFMVMMVMVEDKEDRSLLFIVYAVDCDG